MEYRNGDTTIKTDTKTALVHHNTWRNEFGDFIARSEGYFDKRGAASCYTITIDGKYIKSVGGLNLAKNFINEKRKIKCKWTSSVE